MSHLFTTWARQVTFLVLFVSVIEMLLPAGELRRYVKVVLGLVVLVVLLDPLLRLARGTDLADALLLPTIALSYQSDNPVSSGEQIASTLAKETVASVESSVAADVARELQKLPGVISARVCFSGARPQVSLLVRSASPELVAQARTITAELTGVDQKTVDIETRLGSAG